MHNPTSLIRPSLLSCLALTLVIGCGESEEAPVPVESDPSDTPPVTSSAQNVQIGINLADPNRSPLCPVQSACPTFYGETTMRASRGSRSTTCSERHFMTDRSTNMRSLINEVTRGYSDAGMLTSISDDQGTTSFAYDEGNRLTEVAYRSTFDSTQANSTLFTYDDRGRLLNQTQQDAYGSLTSQTSYTYDEFGRTSTSLNRTFDGSSVSREAYYYNYNAGGTREVWRDTDFDQAVSAPDSLLGSYTWQDNGRLLTAPIDQSAPSGGSYNYSYDDQGRLSGVQTSLDGQMRDLYDYTYDDFGFLQEVGVNIDGIDGRSRLGFERNDFNQVTGANFFLPGSDTPDYEIQFEGSCDRTMGTWQNTAQTIAGSFAP